MRILYLSCHSILEYDEVKMLHELGHYVFSPGAYVEPRNPGDTTLRPGIPDLVYDEEDLRLLHQIGQYFPGDDAKNHLTKELVDRFDVVIVMHLPRWIHANWGVLREKPTVWRTIGQSVVHNENELRKYRSNSNFKIVRYSPMEWNIPGFIGADALIRFYKDQDEFKDWNGKEKAVITFGQSMTKRADHCGWNHFNAATAPFSRKIYGPGNEEAGEINQGKKTYDELRAAMRDHRAYFYTGTIPASYTLNFMESWMTGIPLVAIGPKLGNSTTQYGPPHNLYEIQNLIQNGLNGFISDDVGELSICIHELMENENLAKTISENGRKSAIEIFGKDKIYPQWQEFLKTL